jgi:hypothetical protein
MTGTQSVGGSGGSGLGGALFNLDGNLTIQNSTLDANSVLAGPGGLDGAGGRRESNGGADGGQIFNLAFGGTTSAPACQSALR